MGNRGMTNWKLSAFFVMSLMLVAAVFSNTAMAAANDGAGSVAVATDLTDAAGTDGVPIILATSVTGIEALAAGSKNNALQFTYIAHNLGDDPDTENVETDFELPIDMASGRVRIAFPAGWTVSNRFVQVTDGGTDNVIFETGPGGVPVNPDGALTGTPESKPLLTGTALADANAAVSQDGSNNITINLGTGWGRTRDVPTRSLVIIFSEVTASTAAGPATFTSSSSARGGNLRRLTAGSPMVTVDNILGVNVPALADEAVDTTLSDPLSRDVVITPTKVYPDEEDHRFTITFTAPGPMNGATLQITVPTPLRPTPFDTTTIRVLGRGGADIVEVTDDDINTDGSIDITLTKISAEQKVVVTYPLAEVGARDATESNNLFTAGTDMAGGSSFTDVTKLEGGLLGAVMGSGRMVISPASMENGETSRTFTLTYTAYTAIEGDIVITPKGIVVENDSATANVTEELQSTSSGGYGYVTGSASPSGSSTGTLDTSRLADGIIAWEGAMLAKNAKLTTTVRRVHITEDAGNYEWVTTVGAATTGTTDNVLADDPTTEDVNEVATLTVVNTERDSVKFEVIKGATVYAADKTSIEFRFTAEATPIRDGTVSFVVPAALGSAPAASDAEDTAGTVNVTSDGGADALKGAEKVDQIKVSGRTITVNIGTLDVSESVTITYGGAAKSATVVGNKAGDVKVIGNYRTSTGTRPAGIATVKILNVKDGAAGTVTIGPQQVEAGSNHGVVSVKFTALGTMDDGQVSLDLPASWGTFQRDPAKRNYVQISGNSNVSLTEPAVGESGSKAVAKITKLAAGQSFTFVYGGGSAGSANGAEVQDNIGVATFIIESDGDGDDLFDAVKSETVQTDTEKIVNPDKLGTVFMDADGLLKVEVEAAADGTGTVVVDPTMVRSAAADVKLTFTYTSTQTIQDGELRFTVPSGWSAAQVSDAGAAGLHRRRWKRSRNR